MEPIEVVGLVYTLTFFITCGVIGYGHDYKNDGPLDIFAAMLFALLGPAVLPIMIGALLKGKRSKGH